MKRLKTGSAAESVLGLWGVSNARNILGVVIAVIVLTALYFVQTNRIAYFQIVSNSMEPTLKIGERYVMAEAPIYGVGDIIVLLAPGKNDEFLTKRIIATGPATVDLMGGQLYVDGRRNDPPQGPTRPLSAPDREWRLKPGEYFVAGDNRPRSYDSRDYGPITKDRIKGKLFTEKKK